MAERSHTKPGNRDQAFAFFSSFSTFFKNSLYCEKHANQSSVEKATSAGMVHPHTV